MNKLRVKEVSNIDGKFLVLENDAIGKDLLEGKRWEPHFSEIVGRLVKQGNVCVDAGANFGHHTIVMANAVGDKGLVHSFEPLRIIYQQLCANVFYNGLTNVNTYNIALGDKRGYVTMNPVDYFSNWVNIGDTEVGKNGDRVEIYPLDQIERVYPDFMKIDVQGSEVNLLEGAMVILLSAQPIIFIEVEELHLNHFGTTSAKLIEKIKEYDYEVFQIVNEYPCDHICFPKKRVAEVELIRESSLYKLVQV